MLKLKKSQIVFSIFFIFWAFLNSANFPEIYGQNSKEDGIVEKNPFARQPQTINLKPEQRIISINASDNEKQLYVTEQKGLLYSFDLESSEQLWVSDLGGKIASNLIETENFVYVVTSIAVNSASISDNPIINNDTENISAHRSVLWAIDKETGITNKKYDEIDGVKFHLFKGITNICLIGENSLTVFDIKLGKLSEYPFAKKLNSRIVFDEVNENIFLVFEDEIKIVSAKPDNSYEITTLDKYKKDSLNVLSVSGNIYMIGDTAGNLSVYQATNKKRLWKFRAGGKISDIEVFVDKIIVSSYDNFIYCFDKISGERIWKKRFPGRISKIERSSEDSFFVRSGYSPEYYQIDIPSGNVIGQYIKSNDTDTEQFELTTTPRLIIIQYSDSIDIYRKN